MTAAVRGLHVHPLKSAGGTRPARLDHPLPMNRFRPSIVVEGLGAYGEDSVDLLRIGDDAETELVKPFSPCVITTTDQDSGVRGREALRTLASYRTRRKDDGSRALAFGQNGTPRTVGTIRAGDRVCASTRRTHP